jgi:hypothetical protein
LPLEGTPLPGHPRLVLSLVSIYLLTQILVPLRHLLYPGRVDWTYEGHRFSWRMKLIDRDARAQFYVINPNNGETLEVDPDAILSPHQTWKMAARPDMILQFAHYLARKVPFYGTKPLRVEARVLVSLNGRKPALLVDQNVDLAAQPRTLKHAPWLLPVNEPLPDRQGRKAAARRMNQRKSDRGSRFRVRQSALTYHFRSSAPPAIGTNRTGRTALCSNRPSFFSRR